MYLPARSIRSLSLTARLPLHISLIALHSSVISALFNKWQPESGLFRTIFPRKKYSFFRFSVVCVNFQIFPRKKLFQWPVNHLKVDIMYIQWITYPFKSINIVRVVRGQGYNLPISKSILHFSLVFFILSADEILKNKFASLRKWIKESILALLPLRRELKVN